MDNLRGYQQKAARVIYDFFNSNEKKAKIYLSTGLGRTAIIVSSIQLILQNRNVSVAILSPKRILCEQLQAAFTNSFVNNGVAMHLHEFKGQEILITTYQEVIKQLTQGHKEDIYHRTPSPKRGDKILTSLSKQNFKDSLAIVLNFSMTL